MNAAKIPFTVMQFFGVWRPKSWTSQWAIQFYKIYSVLMMFALLTFAVGLIIYILKFSEDLNSLTESLLVFSVYLAVGMKILNIFVHRDEIIALDDMFFKNICIPRDPQEVDIQKKFEFNDRTVSISLLSVVTVFNLVLSLCPLLTKSTSFVPLPFEQIWIPYSMESRVVYWLTYFYQTLNIFAVSSITGSVDLCLLTMSSQICTQLKIFKHRLSMLPSKVLQESDEKSDKKFDQKQHELQILSDCMVHHSHVYTIGAMLNGIFGLMIFAQFFISAFGFSIIIYQLSKIRKLSPTFWLMLCFLNNYMLQISFYCWYGEEMIYESTDIANTLYSIFWNLLTLNTKKCLIVIMIRACRPIELVGASMITLSLETLVKIMKASYSAFSVLRSS